MKKLIIIHCLCFTTLVEAQIVSDKTNLLVIDYNKEDVTTILPEILWESPRTEFSHTQESSVDVSATINSIVPLKKVTIGLTQHKDIASRAARPIDVASNPSSVNVSQKLYLMEGENWIEIQAENEEGGIVKDYRSVLYGVDAISDAIAIDRKDHALLFAIDKYDNFKDLVNPVFDAKSMADDLTSRYGFDVEIVENASQDEVMVKLREYAQRTYKPQDQLMIFFAGHGLYDDVYGEGYVVAKNSMANDVGKNSYISHNRIRNNINNIPCAHVLLVMDVCFGGTFDPTLASSRDIYEESEDRQYLAKKLSKKTRKYLTSGSKEYVSDGIMGQHSPFASKFIEALKSNGGEDRILVLDEIKLYMERLKTTPRFGGFGHDEQGSDFVFVAK